MNLRNIECKTVRNGIFGIALGDILECYDFWRLLHRVLR